MVLVFCCNCAKRFVRHDLDRDRDTAELDFDDAHDNRDIRHVHEYGFLEARTCYLMQETTQNSHESVHTYGDEIEGWEKL